jgi:hypothetical protein
MHHKIHSESILKLLYPSVKNRGAIKPTEERCSNQLLSSVGWLYVLVTQFFLIYLPWSFLLFF